MELSKTWVFLLVLIAFCGLLLLGVLAVSRDQTTSLVQAPPPPVPEMKLKPVGRDLPKQALKEPLIPPPPEERAKGQTPKFISTSVVRMSGEERFARARLFAADGPESRYLALDPTTLPVDERIRAQRQMIEARRGRARDPALVPIRELRNATERFYRTLWSEGSTELARWVFERGVDLQGTMSDGPPDPSKVALVACALREAASLCEVLGYRRCSAADDLLAQSEDLCIEVGDSPP
jgi:hypothetical protein